MNVVVFGNPSQCARLAPRQGPQKPMALVQRWYGEARRTRL